MYQMYIVDFRILRQLGINENRSDTGKPAQHRASLENRSVLGRALRPQLQLVLIALDCCVPAKSPRCFARSVGDGSHFSGPSCTRP